MHIQHQCAWQLHNHVKLHCSSPGLHREHKCAWQLHHHTVTSSHTYTTAAQGCTENMHVHGNYTITPSHQTTLQQHKEHACTCQLYHHTNTSSHTTAAQGCTESIHVHGSYTITPSHTTAALGICMHKLHARVRKGYIFLFLFRA